MSPARSTVCALALLVHGAAHLEGQDVSALDWFAGCWAASAGGTVIEEQWTDTRGGVMLGMSRTIRRDTVVAYEALRVQARDGRLVYAASPSGQPPAEFLSETVSDTLVVFANPTHDFPQRIRYRRVSDDSLTARVEGTRNGEQSGFDFRYVRVTCPGSF